MAVCCVSSQSNFGSISRCGRALSRLNRWLQVGSATRYYQTQDLQHDEEQRLLRDYWARQDVIPVAVCWSPCRLSRPRASVTTMSRAFFILDIPTLPGHEPVGGAAGLPEDAAKPTTRRKRLLPCSASVPLALSSRTCSDTSGLGALAVPRPMRREAVRGPCLQ